MTLNPARRRFEGKVAIVTGAGYGIGRAIALSLGEEGAALALAARSRARLEEVAEAIRAAGGRAEVIVTDVADESSVERMTAGVLQRLGCPDVLINNAGIAGPTKLARDITREEWSKTLATNLTGAFFCAKHVVRPMIERGRGGAIVNVASVAGRIGYPMRTPYAASKWGMIGLNHSLAAELGPMSIRVNCVCPGPVQGERMENVVRARAEASGIALEKARHQATSGIPLGRWVTPEEVAQAVLFLASEADASGITGQAFTVCGGLRMQ